MASVELKSKARSMENGGQKQQQQTTLTMTFVPERESYERPKNMEEYTRTYFESINGISRRIIAEERKIIAQNRNTWPTLSVEERDKLLNDRMVNCDVRQKYNSDEEYWKEQTPWQVEKLTPVNDEKRTLRDDKTQSLCNDSFSTPFQWATKSQRNIRFPDINREKLNTADRNEEVTKPQAKVVAVGEDKIADRVPNAEKDIKGKQEKTESDNMINVTRKTDNSPQVKEMSSFKPQTSINGHRHDDEGEPSTAEEPRPDEKQYLDGTKNIFEFLQSWDP